MEKHKEASEKVTYQYFCRGGLYLHHLLTLDLGITVENTPKFYSQISTADKKKKNNQWE